MEHRISYTVYYEDTDSLGVVYYANYFKFFERGRSELLGASGRSVAELNAQGILVVVHSASATFKKPLTLGDRFDVVTQFSLPSPYRGRFTQRIECGGELYVDGVIDTVSLDRQQNLIEFPALFG
ncbi:MAG: YbgC/FadM family acyl-CoA thioesterase [Austwickia sp.]|nr:YbgC/FadM family acyl-CoA thioesterase [Austwickia sp.]MBK8437564.1 YbgC/FadM family acyl-CoA thioesterase [Austwickia sp.]MBK9102830.1 YbgC/FadM family acyl-CoA thioesterase [Austwickia sp.]